MNKLKVSEKFAKRQWNRDVGIFICIKWTKSATYTAASHQMAIKLNRYYFKIIFHVVDYQNFDDYAVQVEAPRFLSPFTSHLLSSTARAQSC